MQVRLRPGPRGERRKHRACCALGGLLALSLALGVQAQPVVERVSFEPESGGVVVRLHASSKVNAFSPPRQVENNGKHYVEMTLFNTGLQEDYRKDAAVHPVQAYKAEARGPHLAVQFEMEPGVITEAAVYPDRATSDLLLKLTPVRETRRPSRTSGAFPAQGRQRAARPPVTRAGERWKLDTIVIDAGHGGASDLGAVGVEGLQEKDVTLAVAPKLGARLEENLDVRVVYTRQDDRFVSLPQRGRIANGADGKLFISIHANAAPSPAARGTETYFLGTHKSEAAERVMARENAVARLSSDADHYSGFDEQALIWQTLASSTYLRASEHLASEIEAQFAEGAGRASRGVKQAGFYVLWGASMPAVLVELGFVTNPSEARFLASEASQDRLAIALFRAVRDFKEAYYEKGLGVTTQR
ncbi:MAG: N-acetylmuramoyl-L-alanine amidase family protein [Rhodothermales bacterium]